MISQQKKREKDSLERYTHGDRRFEKRKNTIDQEVENVARANRLKISVNAAKTRQAARRDKKNKREKKKKKERYQETC